MVEELEQSNQPNALEQGSAPSGLTQDYASVTTTARIAVYDDLKVPPRIIDVPPAPTNEFIESLASQIYEYKTLLGGGIPYSAIREVTENFIHARFSEVVVSILDGGNTIRFCDQGPGIPNKEKAVLPGFTSANEQMKRYIRGVGSGLASVKDYMDVSSGQLTIEDNIDHGAVVTISLVSHKTATPPIPVPPLTEREKALLKLLYKEESLGVTSLAKLADIPQSSAHATLEKLQEAGLVTTDRNKKRRLTDQGLAVSKQLA